MSPLEREKSTRIRGRSKKESVTFLDIRSRPISRGVLYGRMIIVLPVNHYELLRSLFIPTIRTKSKAVTVVYRFNKETAGKNLGASPSYVRLHFLLWGAITRIGY
jgi:hypothetical protein